MILLFLWLEGRSTMGNCICEGMKKKITMRVKDKTSFCGKSGGEQEEM